MSSSESSLVLEARGVRVRVGSLILSKEDTSTWLVTEIPQRNYDRMFRRICLEDGFSFVDDLDAQPWDWAVVIF